MKKYFFIIFIASLILLCGCSNCNSCKKPQPNNYEITFVVDGEHYLSESVTFGDTIDKPIIDEREGYVFKGWYISDEYIEQWDFEEPVYNSFILYAYWVEPEKETFNIIYTDDGIPIHTEKAFKGSCIQKFVPEKEGYYFSDWIYNDQSYDFSTPIYCDITLTAVWDAIKYKVTFIADGEIVAEEYFTADNLLVDIPQVPKKEHYTAEWTKFVYELKDIEVSAIYTPLVYTATFYVDEEIYLKYTYTVEDKISVPEVPSKTGYTGTWDGLPIISGDVTITAEYTPIDYTITYKINGEIVGTKTYNAEKKNITPPYIPEITGYEGHWEDIELNVGDKTINAFYTLKVLYAYFYVDDELYATREFTIENKKIEVPDVPLKNGQTGTWETYILGNEDVTINALYAVNTYNADFMIEDNLIETIKFTMTDEKLVEPEIPANYNKEGYIVYWEDYTLTNDNIIIGAIYEPITYYIKFSYGDGNFIEIPYTIENTKIIEPDLPHKDGYNINWEDYNLTTGDKTININYEPITYYATFTYEDGSTSKVPYTVNDTKIDEPAIPHKAGYSAHWEDYTLTTDDITIDAKYDLITYYATFRYEDGATEKVAYTVNDTKIKEPAPPKKSGYTAQWENYNLTTDNITIDLEYDLITYYAKFLYEDGTFIDVAYTVEDTNIIEPALPQKRGYTAKWEDYSLTSGDITVKSEYELINYCASFMYEDGSRTKIYYTVNDTKIAEPTPPQKNGYIVRWEDYTIPYEDFEINLIFNVKHSSFLENGFTFTLLSNDTYCLSAYIGNKSKVIIPEIVNYLPVSTIGKEVFINKITITEIIIPDSVTEIDSYAFAYTGIKSITLPDNLIQINNIFVGCSKLECVKIGSNTQRICKSAFGNCSNLLKVNIPKSVRYIDARAFIRCTSLNEVIFENSENWSLYADENYQNGPVANSNLSANISLSNTAAKYLKDTYLGYYWKNEQ